MLLTKIIQNLQQAHIDYIVLWSGLQGYYEKLGWRRTDSGVFGRFTGEAKATQAPMQWQDLEFARPHLEDIRAHSSEIALSRETDAWRTLPLPVTHCQVLRTARSYALCGVHGNEHYLYEMYGVRAEFPQLWNMLARGAVQLKLNLCAGSDAHNWLSHHTQIDWQPQQLAQWLPLSRAAEAVDYVSWYIPYFDRI